MEYDLNALYNIQPGERLYTTAPKEKMGRSRTAQQIIAALEKRNTYTHIRRTPKIDPVTRELHPEFEVIIVEGGKPTRPAGRPSPIAQHA
jgi:hypothetical protein